MPATSALSERAGASGRWQKPQAKFLVPFPPLTAAGMAGWPLGNQSTAVVRYFTWGSMNLTLEPGRVSVLLGSAGLAGWLPGKAHSGGCSAGLSWATAPKAAVAAARA